ncbi:MAG: hypothetical protein PVF61_02350 [Gammaproteobacteria bacterium]|jgi:hypothetical protein
MAFSTAFEDHGHRGGNSVRGPSRSELGQRLTGLIQRCRAGRHKLIANGQLRAEFRALARFQADRLSRTHGDLLESDRFGPAASFFLTDLYGDRDYSPRDEDMERVYPVMIRMMPKGALESIARGMEVHALTQELDYRMVQVLGGELETGRELSAEKYAEAYRNCDNEPERERQIRLIGEVGRALDRVVHHTLVYRTVLLAHGPAHMAGFGALHDFIERGFVAFRHMKGADEFIDTIQTRELAIMTAILRGDPAERWTSPGAVSLVSGQGSA